MLVLFDAAAQRGPGGANNPSGANQHGKVETIDPDTGEVGTFDNIQGSSPLQAPTGTSEQPATLDELGLDRRRLSEWRRTAEAGEDVVRQAAKPTCPFRPF